MTRSVSKLGQLNANGCGNTPVGTTEIYISPVCGGAHRLNTNHELSDTIIHEARHTWVNQELKRNDIGVDDDGNSSTASDDDDGDRWAEILGPFPDTADIIEGAAGVGGFPGSTNDHNPDPDPTFSTQELDAYDFANTNRFEYP
jgi:hypothetical protein